GSRRASCPPRQSDGGFFMSYTRSSIPHFERLSAIRPGLLYPHQADGVAFLLSKKRALLADDMGLGKPRQAIVALESAVAEGVVLVVCPASLKLNWKREILMVDPTARIEVIGHDRQPPPVPDG